MPKTEIVMYLAGVDLLFTALVLFVFYLRGWQKQYVAMALYLTMRLMGGIVLLPILIQHAQPTLNEEHAWAGTVFLIYYLFSMAMVFAVYAEMFKMIFPSLRKLRWWRNPGLLWMLALFLVVLVSLSFSTLGGGNFSTSLVGNFMQAVSILELSILAFLTIGMRTLRIRMKDMGYGIATGFAVLALGNLLHSMNRLSNAVGAGNLATLYSLLSLLALVVWGVYAAQPVKRREPVLLPLRTMLKRWNEIATAMGHKETQVVLPRQSGFLKDVERIVDRAFEENFK